VVTRFWILDFGVQFDKLTVRAVTEPVEAQSNDFGFWIGSTLKGWSLKPDIFLIIPFKREA
jgi:hypothetical protein